MKLSLRVQINGDGGGVFRPATAAAAATTKTDDNDATAAATPDDDDAAADDDDAAANDMTVTTTIDMVVPQSVVKSLVDTVASEVLKKMVLKKQSVVNIDECWINDQKLAPTHTTVDDDVSPLHNLPFNDDSTVYDSQSGDGSTDNDMDEDNRPPNLLESSSEEDDDEDDNDNDNDVDDEAGDLPVAPVAAIYEVNQGKEEIYKLSQAMNMLCTHQDYNNNLVL